MARGVVVLAPETVYVADEVNLGRISTTGVVIHPGCRIRGERTVISANCELGAEAPLTLENCALGRGVKLKGGYATASVFLAGVTVGSGAQIRAACLLEEQSSVAHNVGLKQTILFPYATIGSLVNFCDCLLAGGTSRHHHSEVGSGYIHFNFTPAGHKATASLFGEVARGVWLREAPVFLGGGGGAVGPVKVGYGAVVGAGSILKEDVADGVQIIAPPQPSCKEADVYAYPRLERTIARNVEYIAQLIALRVWYHQVRSVFFANLEYGDELLQAARFVLDRALLERIERFKGWAATVRPEVAETAQLPARIAAIAAAITDYEPQFDMALIADIAASDPSYLSAIAALRDPVVATGRQALNDIITAITAKATKEQSRRI
ncbi:MAG: UDP-N-acetylglucosamine pyrophosphorylase [Propionibacteriaceae bacterium]|jgi:UDP-N-acetylglucosamine/UDP-N-acetylgalactosamine diphosphorylase|nr:UDP-N-acetylglucosamine pyrophosphorylase [Propionibacteriaceae bacterium]